VPPVPTTTDNRQGYIAAAIVVWSVPPFPSPRAWTFPVVGNLETGAGRLGAALGWLLEPFAHTDAGLCQIASRRQPR
jgi:hypothetical protein